MERYYLIEDLCVCCGAPVAEGRQICLDCEARLKQNRPKGMSLLDAISIQMGCGYLSDLRYLDSGQRAMLAQKLERIPLGHASLFEWNDALEYLAGAPPCDSQAAAKETLLMLLTQPRSAGQKIEKY